MVQAQLLAPVKPSPSKALSYAYTTTSDIIWNMIQSKLDQAPNAPIRNLRRMQDLDSPAYPAG